MGSLDNVPAVKRNYSIKGLLCTSSSIGSSISWEAVHWSLAKKIGNNPTASQSRRARSARKPLRYPLLYRNTIDEMADRLPLLSFSYRRSSGIHHLPSVFLGMDWIKRREIRKENHFITNPFPSGGPLLRTVGPGSIRKIPFGNGS
jgi:hypothetical protein